MATKIALPHLCYYAAKVQTFKEVHKPQEHQEEDEEEEEEKEEEGNEEVEEEEGEGRQIQDGGTFLL